MKTLGVILILLMSLQSQAALDATYGIVGGPFKGTCILGETGKEKKPLQFHTMPNDKIGVKLDDGWGGRFLQVINDSYHDRLSVAVIYAQNAVTQPPGACPRVGEYKSCDFVKKPWDAPINSGAGAAFENLYGSLEVIDPLGMRNFIPHLVDVRELKIDTLNSGFNYLFDLKVDATRKLECNVSYINLF